MSRPTTPEPSFDDGQVKLYLGDCLDVLAAVPDASIDSVVTDPPYGLAELPADVVVKAITAWAAGDRTHVPAGRGFMGREWDRFVPPPGVWDECMRVLKPGGHLLCFAGSRTVDLMTISIRMAGFEIRDSIAWMYGAGMPKSLDVSKAIDKAAGAERTIIATGTPLKRMIPGASQNRSGSWIKDDGRAFVPTETIPATDDAALWSGWGTGLRPSHEPIVVARKRLVGTVAANVLEHGTGALNIDACRIGESKDVPASPKAQRANPVYNGVGSMPGRLTDSGFDPNVGRWPANVVLTHSTACEPIGVREVRTDGHHPAARGSSGYEGGLHGHDGLAERKSGTEVIETWDCAEGCPVAELDRQSGVLTSGANPTRRSSDKFQDAYGDFAGQQACVPHRGADAGGASRFFPVFRWQAKAPTSERPRLEDGTAHPTVKPLDLIRFLTRLVTRPGGTVLDPFGGSGTTAEACIIEGFDCVLVEKDPAHAELIKARLSKPIQPVMFGDAL